MAETMSKEMEFKRVNSGARSVTMRNRYATRRGHWIDEIVLVENCSGTAPSFQSDPNNARKLAPRFNLGLKLKGLPPKLHCNGTDL